MKKRFLNLLLVLVLVVCVLPMAVFADACDHEGTLVLRPAQAATCETNGYSQSHIYCTACKKCMVYEGGALKVISSPVIEATNHNWENGACTECKTKCQHPVGENVDVPGYDATCFKEGRTKGVKCGVCGQTLKSQLRIAKTNHVFDGEETVTKAATCFEAGTMTIHCSADGCTETTEEVIPANTHRFNDKHECVRRGCTFVCNHEGTLVETVAAKDADCYNGAISAGYECTLCGYVDEPEATTSALGHKTKTKITKKATCTEVGEKVITCENCSYTKTEEIPVDPDAHKVVVVAGEEATCTKTGWTDGKKCERCEAVLEYRFATDALGHDFENGEVTITREASCDKYGLKYTTCSRCDAKTEVETFDKLPHNMTSKVLLDATCTKTGSKKVWCTTCDLAPVYETLPLVDHTIVDIAEVPATCAVDGSTAGKWCSVCDATLEGRDVIPATGEHNYTEFVKVVTPAACEVKLVERYKCATCDDTKQVWGEALGHDFENGKVTITREATCDKYGLKYTTCARCDAKTEVETFAKLEHTITSEVMREATCVEDGYKKVWCTGCNERYDNEVIPKLEHTITSKVMREATCTKDGYKMVWCTGCNERYDNEVIPKLEHTITSEVMREPTCTEGGYKKVWCTGCNERFDNEAIAALGHDYVVLLQDDATCTNIGRKGEECNRCGHQVITAIEATGHTEEAVPAVAATCTATGLTAGKKCATCNFVIEAQKEVPMTTHTMVDKKGETATCAKDGYTDYKECSVCGLIEGKETVKAAHKFENFKCVACQAPDPRCTHPQDKVTFVHEDATCTKTGIDGWKCEICGEQREKVLPVAPHEVEVQNTPATCTAKGETKKVCTVCTQVLERIEIPMIAHDYRNGACRVCGAIDPGYSAGTPGAPSTPSTPSTPDTPDTPAAPGTSECQHPKSTVTNPATCTTSGYTIVTCTTCNRVVSKTLHPALGHSYEVDIQQPTCTKSGAKVTKCEVCGDFDYEVLPATNHHSYNAKGICSTCNGSDPSRFSKDFQNLHVIGGPAY